MATISVTDDAGNRLTLAQPAMRIISLAPHVTELLFAAGAGEQLVGTVEHSDYPQAAKNITRIGSHNAIDLERIVALKPDLIVVWQSGTAVAPVEKLRQLGLPVYASEPETLQDIARNLRDLGTLAGTQASANTASNAFLEKLSQLKLRYAAEKTVSVFYQVWHQPMMTVNGAHMISQVIELCGGHNVFADLPALAPKISLESVLLKDPQVIIGGSVVEANPDWKKDWDKWPQIRAVKEQQIFYINPDYLQRQTPRILEGAELLCEKLESVRKSK